MAPARRRGEGGTVGFEPGRAARASDAHEAALHTSDERFRLATEALAGFLYDYDLTTGHVERFGGMGDVLGFNPAAIPPTPEWWIERMDPADLPRVMRAAKEAFESDAPGYFHEYRMRHRQRHYIYIADRGRIVRDAAGRPLRALGGVNDITDRMVLLEREQEARTAAEAAARARDEVLSIVSHDLRNPISTIAICASALSESVEGSSQSTREIVRAISRSAEWMNRLIKDLVDVTSIESRGLVIELRDETPHTILEAVAELFAAEARERGVLLETRIPPALPRISADRDRILQALANLMKNALKFTDRGGRITLRAEATPDAVRFDVEDTGAGIAEEDLPHVFERYWQKTRGEEGSGLGLAIVKGIVDAHGGQVAVESTPGRETRFSFTIPAKSPAEGGKTRAPFRM